MTEDEMVGWHHQLNGHEFEQTLGDSEGQGSLVCSTPWGCKELDMTEWLNNHIKLWCYLYRIFKRTQERITEGQNTNSNSDDHLQRLLYARITHKKHHFFKDGSAHGLFHRP